MDEITIRRATIDDALLLSRLGARLFEQTFGPENTPEDMQQYLAGAFSVDRQREELSDSDRSTSIAEDAGHAPIGYVMLKRGTRSDGVSGAKPVEIQRIYADNAWHGRGVGASLMRAAIDQARAWHGDELWLAVWEKNPRAIAFYQKSGFRAVGRQLFQLGSDTQHDVVMALALVSNPD